MQKIPVDTVLNLHFQLKSEDLTTGILKVVALHEVGEEACKLAVKLNEKNNDLRSWQLTFDTALLILPYGKN